MSEAVVEIDREGTSSEVVTMANSRRHGLVAAFRIASTRTGRNSA